MSQNPKIVIIGAAIIDLIGYSKNKLIYKDSNIGTFETTLGGVGRNIAENLSRLSIDVEFISMLADDDFSKKISFSCNNLGISTKHCTTIKNSNTPVYLAIMDHHNDLALGLSAMDIFVDIPQSFITNSIPIISEYSYCVLDTNMPATLLEQVTNSLPNVLFALDTVSSDKTLRAKTILKNLHILKCNLMEAELLSGLTFSSETDCKKLATYFINKGVTNVFITLGKDGVVYGNAEGIYKSKIENIKPISTNGAGDSFMAGLIFGEMHDFDIHKTVLFAAECAKKTIQHKNNVHPNLNKEQILKSISC